MQTWMLRGAGALAFLLLLTAPATATPSFALEISFGGVDELAVGETLQCYVYRPTVHRRADVEPMPLQIPFAWKVVPAGAATIDEQGRLKAVKPGTITVHVDDAREIPKGELPAGMPGQRNLVLRVSKVIDGKRLPRVQGVAGLDHFKIGWTREYDNKQRQYVGERFLSVGMSTKRWHLSVGTDVPKPDSLPWTLKRVKRLSSFRDDGYHDLLFQELLDRWEANLTDATLTIDSFKAGIARGTLTFKTTRGVNERVKYVARIPDPDGRLARAAAAAKKK